MPIATRMTADLATEHLNETEADRIPDAPVRAPQDRRRPGRSEHVLTRADRLAAIAPPDADVLRSEDRKAENALGTAQGILLGTVLGLPTWAGSFWLVKNLLG